VPNRYRKEDSTLCDWIHVMMGFGNRNLSSLKELHLVSPMDMVFGDLKRFEGVLAPQLEVLCVNLIFMGVKLFGFSSDP
jgi:hypothetical protein